ncbi:hypothetical protein OH784_26885 [Ectobacillus funiculus]|uniref:hypothetical protein n=1 Tax=Ectobacillus funiculus TaxID=137993 RepID=UPI003978A4A3
MKRRIGVFTVLLLCSLALFACSVKQETNGQAIEDTKDTSGMESSSNTSNKGTEQTEMDPVEELKLVESEKREIYRSWEVLKNVDAPKVNEPVQVWEEYYAKLGLSNRVVSQFTSSSEKNLTYVEGKNDPRNEQEELFVSSFSISPHSVEPGYDTIMSLQDALAIVKNLIPEGYEQKEERFSILYQDPPSLLTYQVEYVANESAPKGSESLYLVIHYNNLGVSSASIGREKSSYNQPEMEGKYTYLKPDLINDEAALKSLTEVKSQQDIKPEYIEQ